MSSLEVLTTADTSPVPLVLTILASVLQDQSWVNQKPTCVSWKCQSPLDCKRFVPSKRRGEGRERHLFSFHPSFSACLFFPLISFESASTQDCFTFFFTFFFTFSLSNQTQLVYHLYSLLHVVFEVDQSKQLLHCKFPNCSSSSPSNLSPGDAVKINCSSYGWWLKLCLSLESRHRINTPTVTCWSITLPLFKASICLTFRNKGSCLCISS